MHILAHAKINLNLQILGKRPDGYHEISTVMQALTLADEVEVELTETPGIALHVVKPDAKNADEIPEDPTNLAYRAAKALFDFYAQKGAFAGPAKKSPGVSVVLRKRIPAAAGLAGGSSDAAAVLVALRALLSSRFAEEAPALTDEDLYAIGKTLGADVPYCIFVNSGKGSSALCTGIGDVLTPLNTPGQTTDQTQEQTPGQTTKQTPDAPGDSAVRCARSSEPAYVLLVKPPVAVSTPEIYRLYDNGGVPEAANVLEPVAKRLCPEIEAVEREIRALGHAEAVQMSGSGPTVFALYHDMAACKKDAEYLKTLPQLSAYYFAETQFAL